MHMSSPLRAQQQQQPNMLDIDGNSPADLGMQIFFPIQIHQLLNVLIVWHHPQLPYDLVPYMAHA